MLALALVAAILLANTTFGSGHARCQVSDQLGAHGAGEEPSSCWRPY